MSSAERFSMEPMKAPSVDADTPACTACAILVDVISMDGVRMDRRDALPLGGGAPASSIVVNAASLVRRSLPVASSPTALSAVATRRRDSIIRLVAVLAGRNSESCRASDDADALLTELRKP